MTLLLDTSVLIDVLRERNQRREFVTDLAQNGNRLATSVVNVAELYSGARAGDEFAIEAFLRTLQILSVTPAMGRTAGKLRSAWAIKGRTFATPDMLIAATAIELDLTLMTDNRRDFPMPELRLFDLPPA